MPNEVLVDKAELLSILQTNRDNHRAKFLKAQEGYRARVIEEFDRRLKDARAGNDIDLYFHLTEPEDHTEDYDREIRMLQMSQQNQITLVSREFDWYVMDRWGWSESFKMSNAAYGVR